MQKILNQKRSTPFCNHLFSTFFCQISVTLDTVLVLSHHQPPTLAAMDDVPNVEVFEDVLPVSETLAVKVKLIKMSGGSILVHVADQSVPCPNLSNLTLSIGNDSTNVRNPLQVLPLSLSKAISNKCNEGRPVYLSYNCSDIPGSGSDLIPLISSSIVKYVTKCLDGRSDGQECKS